MLSGLVRTTKTSETTLPFMSHVVSARFCKSTLSMNEITPIVLDLLHFSKLLVAAKSIKLSLRFQNGMIDQNFAMHVAKAVTYFRGP